MINRQCQVCFGYDLDDGTNDLCHCDTFDDEIVKCKNECGEMVRLGGFCSTECSIIYKMYYTSEED